MLHTFAICAYKESEFLEECIKSLLAQTVRSRIFIATSTPNDYIDKLAKKYNLKVYVNSGQGGITQDWNFALSKVRTRFATIAHQDDLYEPKYTEKIMKRLRTSKKPLVAFTDYYEIRNGIRYDKSTMLRIKRLMLLPMRIPFFKSSRFVRRRCMSVGDPIICPSIMYCMDNLKQPFFSNHFLACEDWEMLERFSREKGDFLYIPERLTAHRIHEDSTTTVAVKGGIRKEENYEMIRKFWPDLIAKMICHYYNKSEKYNNVENV
ncbi:MAG: glycosyltransferase [Lachnospiraceae bacterium]|nr:glycosyltransferase [Lachnospiraceae bacterium]